jgi:hypothetical protein
LGTIGTAGGVRPIRSVTVRVVSEYPDLLAVAASGSAPRRRAPCPDIEAWVADLPAAEREALLVGLLRGDEPHLRATTLRRMGTPAIEASTGRTAGQLVDAACARHDALERAEKQRRERAAAETAHLAAKARRRQLEELAAEGERAWSRVATRIAEKRPVGYDIAVGLLGDLQDVTAERAFDRRIAALKEEHRRKPGFLQRLSAAGCESRSGAGEAACGERAIAPPARSHCRAGPTSAGDADRARPRSPRTGRSRVTSCGQGAV